MRLECSSLVSDEMMKVIYMEADPLDLSAPHESQVKTLMLCTAGLWLSQHVMTCVGFGG